MGGDTAVVLVGIGLLLTLLVGMASQRLGRSARGPARAPDPPRHGPTPEQQEDLDAVARGIEAARAELLWLRDQVARERAALERLRRQTGGAGRQQQPPQGAPGGAGRQQPPPQGPGASRQAPPPAATADSPWVVLGLRPGAGADDIRRRYRLLSRVWHPDRFIDGPPELRAEAELMMARLNRAHNALSGQAASAPRGR